MLLLPTGELELLPAVKGRPVNHKAFVHDLFAVKLCAATLDESPYLALRFGKLQPNEKIDNYDAGFSLSAFHFRSAIRRNNGGECEIFVKVEMSEAMKSCTVVAVRQHNPAWSPGESSIRSSTPTNEQLLDRLMNLFEALSAMEQFRCLVCEHNLGKA